MPQLLMNKSQIWIVEVAGIPGKHRLSGENDFPVKEDRDHQKQDNDFPIRGTNPARNPQSFRRRLAANRFAFGNIVTLQFIFSGWGLGQGVL